MSEWHKSARAHRRLNTGDRGEDVRRLQIALDREARKRGWKMRVGAHDGVFGRKTRRLWFHARWALGLPAKAINDGHPLSPGAQRNVRQPWTRSRAARKRAQERRPKRPKAGQLSPNFHISEFDCHNGEKVPAYMEDDLREWCRIFGEPLRAQYGAAIVTSGYRPQAYNASIGGEPNSFHRYELRKSQPAGDIRFVKGNPDAWGGTAKALRNSRNGGNGGVGIYPGSGFVHCDTRTYPSNWWG